MKKILLLVIFLVSTLLTACQDADANLFLWDSFEKKNAWRAVMDEWDAKDRSLNAQISKQFTTDGSFSLELKYHFAGEGFATFVHDNPALKDWSVYKGIKIDFHNDSLTQLDVAFAFNTGNSWEWHETPPITLAPKANKGILFDFSENLKTAASGWKFTTKLSNPDDVKRLVIKIWGNNQQEASLFVDKLRLVPVDK